MEFKIGDYVTRKKYNNDIIFEIINIVDDNFILRGLDFRLYADSIVTDLEIYNAKDYKTDDERTCIEMQEYINKDRNEYFYLPGKIVHIDGDINYLNRCLNFYKKSNVQASGFLMKETEIKSKILNILKEYNPDILVITGHDALYDKDNTTDLDNYKNTNNFIKSVQEARKYEKSHEKLIIISGACQSFYEELLKAGSNFASSPKRINIHALDPAIIATALALSDRSIDIDLLGIIKKTKYGSKGIGGIKTKGTMYVGYPR